MKLLFLGDFFFDSERVPDDLEHIAEFIRENDYKVILNLEGALQKTGKPIKKRGANLVHSSSVYDALERLNVVAVCLANNHMMDYGGSSLQIGLDELRKHKINCVGAGMNKDEANEALKLVLDGREVYIQNFGWDVEETVYATDKKAGCAALVSDEVILKTKEIRRSSPNAHIINCFHWGFEFNTLPMPVDIQFAHDCIDSGCNLIIGHHPHVIQPKEEWDGKEIFYSLGNFYFSSRRSNFTVSFPNDSVPNMCDYGLAVEYDLDTQETSCFNVYYDRNLGQTLLFKEVQLIDNITGVDYRSDEYIAQAKKHASNVNPILGLSAKQNQKMIKKLYFKYWIAGRIRFIRKNPIGDRIYVALKKSMSS